MLHTMHLYPRAFDEIKCGKKTREYRLYDEKRQKIQVGDCIRFLRLPEEQEQLTVRVEARDVYPSWYSCYEAFFAEDFAAQYSDVASIVQNTYANYWPKEKETACGCVVFTIVLVADTGCG